MGGGEVDTTAGGVMGLGSEGMSLQDVKQDPNWRLVLYGVSSGGPNMWIGGGRRIA